MSMSELLADKAYAALALHKEHRKCKMDEDTEEAYILGYMDALLAGDGATRLFEEAEMLSH